MGEVYPSQVPPMTSLRSFSVGLQRLSALKEKLRVRPTSRRPAATRSLPASAFALPESRKFPIHDQEHAAVAILHLARLGKQQKNPAMAAMVLAAIKRRWPAVYRAERASVRKAIQAHGMRTVGVR